MSLAIDWDFTRTSPKQQRFFLAAVKHLAYGGARGGGKSWAVQRKASLLALRYRNLKILLLRRTFPELEANHIIPLQVLLKGIAVYQVSKKMFIFPNGSFIKLGFCKHEADALQYQGAEYDVIFFEEATLFSEFQIQFISTCARNTRTDFMPRIYYTCNPGGVGHGYIKRLFIDRDFTDTEVPENYEFIPALIYDNEALMENDPTYILTLDSLPEELRKAHRDGDWNALSGQYFREWKKERHLIEPFIIPANWKRYITIDYGLDMLAAYWIAVDFMGRCFAYREHCEANLIISDAAKLVLKMSEGEEIQEFFVPPDLNSKRQDSGKSAISIFAEHGIDGTMTRNDRVHGWLAVKEMLKYDEQLESPRLIFFNSCKYAAKYFPLLQRDDRDPNDISQEPHEYTHVADAARYFCSSYLELPEEEQRPITGTFYRGELIMRGYSVSNLRKLENQGLIRLVG
jgi:phage terminase large subunit